MDTDGSRLLLDLAEMSSIAATVATYCDRVEHNEASDHESLVSAGRRLRRLAIFISASTGTDLQASYADRLARIEKTSAYEAEPPTPASEVRAAETWREIQLAQIRHDRQFHPDVFGMSRHAQLVHVALHLTKLCGALAQLYGGSVGVAADFERRRLPDMLLFGVKLSTLAGERLGTQSLRQELLHGLELSA